MTGIGCGNGSVSAGDSPSPDVTPYQSPPLMVVSPTEVLPFLLDPLWTQQYDRPVTAALAGDGGSVIVGRSYISGVEYWGAIVYDATGKQLWTKTYREERYRTIRVGSLAGGQLFSVAVYTYSNPGVVYAYGPGGQRLWSRSVRSSVSLATGQDADVLYGVDHGNRVLFAANLSSGATRTVRTVAEDATLEVSGGKVLVHDGSTVLLLDANDKVLQRQAVPNDFISVTLAPDGGAVYASTGGADSSVLRFDETGHLIWTTRIPAAGSNSLVVSPTGKHVLAYNVTVDSGLVVLDAQDGSILSRITFAPVEDNASQFIRWAMFLPEQDAVLVDYGVSRNGGSGRVEAHSLLLFSTAGELQARFDAGANVDVLVSDDGQACVTVNNVALDWTAPRAHTLRYYDLTPLFGR